MAFQPSRDSHIPESLRGTSESMFLPSVLPLTHLQECQWGSTDLSRLNETVSPPFRAITYPTRNFATLGPLIVSIDAEASLARSSSFGRISCISLCRSDCIIHDANASLRVVAWRAVSEDSLDCNEPFPARPSDREPFLLIVRTLRFVTAARATSIEGCSEFPANSQVYLRNYNSVQTLVQFYSYGRRLPGLRSRASPCG